MSIGHRVLVVGDDAALVARARRLLVDAGCVVSAPTVAECPLEVLFGAAPCAAVVVDPRAVGAEALLAKLRRDPRSSMVPVLRAPRTLTAASEDAVYSKLVGALFVEAVLASQARCAALVPAPAGALEAGGGR